MADGADDTHERNEARPPSHDDEDADLDPEWLERAERSKAYLASRAPTPYYRLTAEERRAAWAETRAQQRRAARRSRFVPLYLAIASLLAIVLGIALLRLGHQRTAVALLYTSLPLAAFAVIAFAKALVQGLPGGDDGLPPPPGW